MTGLVVFVVAIVTLLGVLARDAVGLWGRGRTDHEGVRHGGKNSISRGLK